MRSLKTAVDQPTQGLRVKVTSQPASEPLSVSDAKDFLKVDYNSDDDLITELIKGCRIAIEDYLNRKLITQTVRASWQQYGSEVTLPYPPVASITSVTSTLNGTATVLASGTDYYTDDDREVLRIVAPVYGAQIKVIYEAGYGGASDVPQVIIEALKRMVSTYYSKRDDTMSGTIVTVTPMIQTLLQGHVNYAL